MKQSNWKTRVIALALAAACLGVGVALAAGEGGAKDPLITLSYLDEVVVPDIISRSEKKAASRQEELSDQFGKMLEQYRKELEQLSQTGTEGRSASYTVVSLENGQQLKLEVGCEVMLRVGSVEVSAASSPALIDVSSGGTVNSGAALEKNHLYMATIADRSLKASGSVKLLVRGGYSVA